MLDVEPAIWQRFVVPASITLNRLHDVMMWFNSNGHPMNIG